jgi:hypothetical protein
LYQTGPAPGEGSVVPVPVYRCRIRIAGRKLATEMIFTGSHDILIGADVLRHFVLAADYPARTLSIGLPSARRS